MSSYLVIFDLGHYKMTYSKEKGEQVEVRDNYLDYSFESEDFLKGFMNSSHIDGNENP